MRAASLLLPCTPANSTQMGIDLRSRVRDTLCREAWWSGGGRRGGPGGGPLARKQRRSHANGSAVVASGRVAEDRLTLKDAAEQAGASPGTLRRWAETGLIPEVGGSGDWTAAAVAHARIVARLRERGHSLDEIRKASSEGRLAFALIEDLLPPSDGAYTIDEASAETGLEPALIERVFATMGFNAAAIDRIGEDDLQLLRYIAAVLSAGFPLVALLQLVRVYGQALAQIADAEVRLFHLYV